MPKIAMRTAPPAMRRVPKIIQRENTSPSMKQAKNPFHRRETAPRGARMTTGSEAIWNSEPRMLEEMKITGNNGQTADTSGRITNARNPSSHSLG